ncbi:MAG: hypothetical protein Q8P81_03255 [Nanoarchaeota archaeon]|nr:hypothetical protein [Nanoarchaeota archaeon]
MRYFEFNKKEIECLVDACKFRIENLKDDQDLRWSGKREDKIITLHNILDSMEEDHVIRE